MFNLTVQYMGNPPIEEGEPTYTTEILAKICKAKNDAAAEAQLVAEKEKEKEKEEDKKEKKEKKEEKKEEKEKKKEKEETFGRKSSIHRAVSNDFLNVKIDDNGNEVIALATNFMSTTATMLQPHDSIFD